MLSGSQDADGDGVPDAIDNCPAAANASQGWVRVRGALNSGLAQALGAVREFRLSVGAVPLLPYTRSTFQWASLLSTVVKSETPQQANGDWSDRQTKQRGWHLRAT